MNETDTPQTPPAEKDPSKFDLDALQAARTLVKRGAVGGVILSTAALGVSAATSGERSAPVEASVEQSVSFSSAEEAAKAEANPLNIQDSFTLDEAIDGDTISRHTESLKVEIPAYTEHANENDASLLASGKELSPTSQPGDEYVISKVSINGEDRLVVQAAPENYVDPDDIQPLPEEGLPTPDTH